MERHDYFVQRLNHLGMFDDNSDYHGMVGRSIETMSFGLKESGHSGMSMAITLALFNKLMNEWETRELGECKPR